MRIRIAESPADILRCFEVMEQLRPHLSREEFVPRVQRMRREGFVLAFLEEDGEVRAVAGYRFLDLLFSGRTLYVDDLVTDQANRSRGHGAALHQWLQDQAQMEHVIDRARELVRSDSPALPSPAAEQG